MILNLLLLLAQDPTLLRLGRPVDGSLNTGDNHRYTVAATRPSFIYGEAVQHTVDVVVTIFGPTGRQLAQFDEPARGPEPFQFRTDEAGTYRIEITPFQQETGRYTLTLLRAEPVARTPEGQVDQIMTRYSGADRAGASIAVTRGGRVIFARGYGMANLEDSIPNTPETVFHIASLSKQFTAFAIAMLADQGRVSLDDDVRRHLPEMPDFGRTITLRHLLNHTSGLRDQWELWAMGGGQLDDVIRQQDLMQLITRQRELNFDPGREYLYSNSGFTVLAEVVARVSGMPFRDWMQQNVFGPLGMTNTQVYDDHTRLVRRRAYSYAPGNPTGLQKSVLSYANSGATSVFTTVNDMALWLRNWQTAQVGGPRVIAMMQQRGVLTNGDTIGYALGISVGNRRGRRVISHNGADAGYRSHISWFPEIDAGVVVLGNASTLNSTAIANQVADAFFPPEQPAAQGQQPAATPPAPAPWQPDAATLARFAGRFYSEELETVYTMVLVDGRLIARHRRHGDIALTPVRPDEFSGNRFFFGNVRFVRNAAGDVTEMRLTGGRVRNLLLRPMP